MRSTVFSIILSLAGASQCIATVTATDSAGTTTPVAANDSVAALTLAPASLELGRHLQKQSIEKRVTLRNNSLDTLVISEVRSDCGCTTAQLQNERLAPGASTTLSVIFETRGYIGEIRRTVTITTSAGTFTLPVSITVSPHKDWDITPLPTSMRPSYSNRPAKLEVVARSRNATKLVTLTTGSANVPWLDVAISPPANGAQTITLLKKPDASPGSHTVAVTLKSDSAEDEPLILQVIVPVAPTISASPALILLPASQPGAEVSATFRIIGWSESTPPVAQSELGRVDYLREISGEHEFRLIYKTTAAPEIYGSVLILNGKKTELEITVVQRVTEPEPAPKPASQ